MPSSSGLMERLSTGWRILIGAGLWVVFISGFHYWLNAETHSRKLVRMGYMPVITNLAAPLLDYASKSEEGIHFEALKFSSFAEMGESLRNGQIHAAFIIAPLSIVLHQQGAGVKLVYIGNRHESTLVYRKDLKVESFGDLAGKSIAVPMRFSGHNLATRLLAEKFGLSGPNLNIVEMNPPDMAPALASGSLDAYFVGEPFAAKTVYGGDSKVLYYVEQIWPNFICNLTVVRQELIEKDPETVRLLVQAAARSGLWAKNNTRAAAEIVSKYWNQPVDLIEYAMNTPPHRIVFDMFVPKYDEMQYMADLMLKFKLLESNNIQGLIDDSFAKNANLKGITDFKSILNPPKK